MNTVIDPVGAAFRSLAINPENCEAQRAYADAATARHDADIAAGLDEEHAFGGSYPGTHGNRLYSAEFLKKALAYGILHYGLENVDFSRVTHDIVHVFSRQVWTEPCTEPVVQYGASIRVEEWRLPNIRDGRIWRRDRPDFGIDLTSPRQAVSVVGERVTFTPDGYPAFQSRVDILMPPSEFYAPRERHDAFCNAALKAKLEKNPNIAHAMGLTRNQIDDVLAGKTPRGMTWHHHQDAGRMQLVREEVHRKIPHGGGMQIWGRDEYKKKGDRHRAFKHHRPNLRPRGRGRS